MGRYDRLAKFIVHTDTKKIFFSGLEDFENKIDMIDSGGHKDEKSWLNKIYNKFSDSAQITDGVEDVEDLEPPMLVETWGLNNDSGSQSPMDEDFRKDLQSNLQ